MITEVEYTGNGSQTTFTFPFPYLRPEYVRVIVNNVVSSNYSLSGTNTVQFVSPPANGAAIKIKRITDSDNLLADFNAGTALREEDLELDFTQVLHVCQETKQTADNYIGQPGGPAPPTSGISVIDNLLSTSPTDALSANQGRVLKGLIDTVNADIAALDARIDQVEADIAALEASGGSSNGAGPGSLADQPVGTIVWLQVDPITPPAGYIYADGGDEGRTVYPQLFEVFGTSYGAGDGTTTFGIPLEANLTNPNAPDTSWHPFIKYGAQVGVAAGLVLFRSSPSNLTTLDAYTLGTSSVSQITLPATASLGTAQKSTMSRDAHWIVGCSQSGTGTDRVVVLKDNGSGGYTLVVPASFPSTASQADTVKVTGIAFDYTGTKCVVMYEPTTTTYILEYYTVVKSTNTFTRVSTSASFTKPASTTLQARYIKMRPNGTAVALTWPVGTANTLVIHQISGGTVVAGTTPAFTSQAGTLNTGNLAWSPDGSWLAMAVYNVTGGVASSRLPIFSYAGGVATQVYGGFVSLSTSTSHTHCDWSDFGNYILWGDGHIYKFETSNQTATALSFDSSVVNVGLVTNRQRAAFVPASNPPRFIWENAYYLINGSGTQYQCLNGALGLPISTVNEYAIAGQRI